MESNTITNYKQRRENFMEPYKNNPILAKTLPEVTAGLLHSEFGINIIDHSHVPIIFTVGWTEILKKLGSEQAEECKVNVCGAELEFFTEKSESDKSTNIVPQMYHIKTPLFMKNEEQPTIGASYKDQLGAKYTAWRSVYALEALTSIENKVFEILINDFGINVMVACAIYPIIGATYAAGIQIARETKQTVNMYNIFEIDVVNDDKIILTPLAYIKQWLKDDSKKL